MKKSGRAEEEIQQECELATNSKINLIETHFLALD